MEDPQGSAPALLAEEWRVAPECADPMSIAPRPMARSPSARSSAWQTAGLDITSTVEEVEAPHRIVWGGPAQGIVAVHAWTLDERDGGVLVRTAESWEGEPVTAQPEPLQAALDGSLRAWLENLKRTAEARTGTSRTLS